MYKTQWSVLCMIVNDKSDLGAVEMCCGIHFQDFVMRATGVDEDPKDFPVNESQHVAFAFSDISREFPMCHQKCSGVLLKIPSTTHLESHDEMSSDYHEMTDVSWSLRIDGVCPNVPKRRNFTTVSAIRRRGRLEHLYLTFYLCLSLNLWELLLKTSKRRHDDKFDWLLQLMNEKQISVISLSFWLERTTMKSLFFVDRSWIFYDLVSWSFHTNEFIVSSWS